MLHFILLLHHRLNPSSHFPPLSPGEESSDQVCCWSSEKVQQVLTSHGMDTHLISNLANQDLSGEVLMWLDFGTKDLDDIGIESIADQQKLKTVIKSLAQKDPLSSQLQGRPRATERPASQPGTADEPVITRGSNGIYVLSYSSVREACGDFKGHELGRGGFGAVYRCQLKVSREEAAYAVKKLDRSSAQGYSEFQKEVEVLTLCRHPNVVPLVAIAVDSEEPCLVYPLMTGGSLATRIQSQERPLDWKSRFVIAVDVLRAIVYLHQDDGRKPAIMHRDIKPENVLLDSFDRARLADVGLARLVERGKASAGIQTTSKLVGTFGYICPVFASEGRYYPSSDGYGIGVVLLQLLTSKSVLDPDARPRELAKRMRKAGPEATALHADPAVGTWSPNVARVMAEVAISLIEEEEEDRMTCSDALAKLEPRLDGLDSETIREGRECIICFEELRNVRFQPCGHMLVCSACWDAGLAHVLQSSIPEGARCYSCRKPIAETSRDFPQTDTFVQRNS